MKLAIMLSRLNIEYKTGGPFGAAIFEQDSGIKARYNLKHGLTTILDPYKQFFYQDTFSHKDTLLHKDTLSHT